MSKVAEFRRHYRGVGIAKSYSGWVNLMSNIGLCLAVLIGCLSQVKDMQLIELLAVPVTFLIVNFEEYLSHRWPSHQRIKGFRFLFKRHSMQHHRFFTHSEMYYEMPGDFEIVLFPTRILGFYFIVFGIPLAGVSYYFWGKNVALLSLSTAVFLFLNLDLLHFYFHLKPSAFFSKVMDLVPIFRRLKENHTIHHNPMLMMKGNYNITYPVMDILFKTKIR
tara:strand:- start:249 stop:908 length:660 start_codon:yes stop_codon:yes gene_type:complete